MVKDTFSIPKLYTYPMQIQIEISFVLYYCIEREKQFDQCQE